MTDVPACLMLPGETSALVNLARDQWVLEIGCWQGRTTAALAKVADRVVAVDHHRGDAYTGRAYTLARYMRHLDAERVRHKAVSVVGGFDRALPALRNRSFGLVFVDGAHDRTSVFNDLLQASRLVSSAGVLAFHDWGRWEVAEVVANQLGQPDELTDSLAMYLGGQRP